MVMVVIMYKHNKSIKDIKMRMAVFEFFGYFSWPYFLPEDIFVHSCSDSRVKIQKCQKNKKTSMIIFRCILVISVRWENELLIFHSIQRTMCVILGTWLLLTNKLIEISQNDFFWVCALSRLTKIHLINVYCSLCFNRASGSRQSTGKLKGAKWSHFIREANCMKNI